jgi:hypothetical protein
MAYWTVSFAPEVQYAGQEVNLQPHNLDDVSDPAIVDRVIKAGQFSSQLVYKNYSTDTSAEDLTGWEIGADAFFVEFWVSQGSVTRASKLDSRAAANDELLDTGAMQSAVQIAVSRVVKGGG